MGGPVVRVLAESPPPGDFSVFRGTGRGDHKKSLQGVGKLNTQPEHVNSSRSSLHSLTPSEVIFGELLRELYLLHSYFQNDHKNQQSMKAVSLSTGSLWQVFPYLYQAIQPF